MILQGTRPEEVLSSRKEHINLESGTWQIAESKMSAGRRKLKMLPETAMIFSSRMAGDSPWLFPSPKKPGAHLTKLNNAHWKVLAETGLRFVIYDFRHTAATRWAERGMPVATIAHLLGHGDLRSVMKYVHPSQQHMDEAMLRYGS